MSNFCTKVGGGGQLLRLLGGIFRGRENSLDPTVEIGGIINEVVARSSVECTYLVRRSMIP